MARTRHQTRKKNNTAKMVLFFLILVILCACMTGLWLRQRERQADYQELVRQVSQMETEYQLHRYGDNDLEETEKIEDTESESEAKVE